VRNVPLSENHLCIPIEGAPKNHEKNAISSAQRKAMMSEMADFSPTDLVSHRHPHRFH
jgi:hypothetical protein